MQAFYQAELQARAAHPTSRPGAPRPRCRRAVTGTITSVEDGYDPQQVERKWQARWRDEGTYQVDNDDPRPPFYCLCMYPYPSGPAHQGHVRNYTFGDLIVRHKTMNGHGVLS